MKTLFTLLIVWSALAEARAPFLPPLPGMPSFEAVAPKAILTTDDVKQREAKLSDPSLLMAAKKVLTNRAVKHDDKTGRRRMDAIQFLAAAVSWKRNPLRARLLDGIEQILLVENLTDSTDIRHRKWVAGDKMELFEILVEYAPERAARLEEKAAGSWLALILHYARARYASFIRRDEDRKVGEVWP